MLSRGRREALFVRVRSWWEAYEPSRILNTPTPAVFSYLSNLLVTPRSETLTGAVDFQSLADFGDAARKSVMTIALSKFVVGAFFRFLMAAAEGVTASKCRDPRLRVARESCDDLGSRAAGGPTGVLVPLPPKLAELIQDFGIFELVAGSRFDAGRSLLAFSRSTV